MNKINVSKFDTDKNLMPAYIALYEEIFFPLKDKNIKLLELGVLKGGSVLMWQDYFKNGHIVGLDLDKVNLEQEAERITLYQGKQNDIELLKAIAEEQALDGFDIVIDDCAHIGSIAKESFDYIFKNHLKSGGFYVIEDWGTGYWETWPDGKSYNISIVDGNRIKSHDYGMVGLVKSLIDLLAIPDINRGTDSSPFEENFIGIKTIKISGGIMFIEKA